FNRFWVPCIPAGTPRRTRARMGGAGAHAVGRAARLFSLRYLAGAAFVAGTQGAHRFSGHRRLHPCPAITGTPARWALEAVCVAKHRPGRTFAGGCVSPAKLPRPTARTYQPRPDDTA